MAVIKVVIVSIKVDQFVYKIRICRPEPTQFVSGERMTDKDGLPYVEGIEDCDNVPDPTGKIVTSFRLTRFTKPSARNADDSKMVSELQCKLVVHMSVVAQPGEQHHRFLRCLFAAPVKHLQLDARRDLGAVDQNSVAPDNPAMPVIATQAFTTAQGRLVAFSNERRRGICTSAASLSTAYSVLGH